MTVSVAQGLRPGAGIPRSSKRFRSFVGVGTKIGPSSVPGTGMSLLKRPTRDELPDDEPVELAALADGSLRSEERAALLDRVATSRELAERLAVQERAIALASSAGAQVEAPATLRTRIDAERRRRRVPAPRRLVLIGSVAAAAVAVTIGLAVSRSGTAGQHFNVALAAPTAAGPE